MVGLSSNEWLGCATLSNQPQRTEFFQFIIIIIIYLKQDVATADAEWADERAELNWRLLGSTLLLTFCLINRAPVFQRGKTEREEINWKFAGKQGILEITISVPMKFPLLWKS